MSAPVTEQHPRSHVPLRQSRVSFNARAAQDEMSITGFVPDEVSITSFAQDDVPITSFASMAHTRISWLH